MSREQKVRRLGIEVTRVGFEVRGLGLEVRCLTIQLEKTAKKARIWGKKGVKSPKWVILTRFEQGVGFRVSDTAFLVSDTPYLLKKALSSKSFACGKIQN